MDTVADALTDTEEDTDADNLGLREELDCAVSEFVAREEGTELRETNWVRLRRALCDTEDDDLGETLKDGDGDGEIDILAENDGVVNALSVTVVAGERVAVMGAEGDGEGIGERESDAAADIENDIFADDDAETDPEDDMLEFDDAELNADGAVDRLGVSNVLGDCEWFGDFE